MEVYQCELLQTGIREYLYYYGSKDHHAGYVTIYGTQSGKWYYIRQNHVSVSDEYDDLQACINGAYKDMLRAKL